MMSTTTLPLSLHSRRIATARWLSVAVSATLACGASGCADSATLTTDLGGEADTTSTVGTSHTVEILSSLSGTRSNGWVVNDSGIAGGWSGISGGRAVRWSDAGEPVDMLGVESGTRGINNDGSIVGWVRLPDGVQRGYIYANAVRIDLEKLEPDGPGSARDINNRGTIVGIGALGHGTNAVVWRRAPDGSYGSPVALGFGSPTQSPRINERGDIAFSAYVLNMHRPLIWPAGPDAEPGEPIWLGRPADGHYYAMDINDNGIVVGSRQLPWGEDPPVAVVWLPSDYDSPVDLGIGEARAINEQNQIVGTTGGSLSEGEPRRPALWTVEPDGTISGPTDVGTPSGYLYGGARDINESGWIIGSSWGPGEVAATLWRPRN